MRGYLARLKAANSGKALPDELPKRSKGAFGSNDSSPGSTFPKTEAANDGRDAAQRWRVTRANVEPLEVIFCPEATRGEVAALYSGAGIEPLPELQPRQSAPADTPTDPAAERRRARALALLAEHPNWARVVVAEAGDPAIIGIAVRGLAYGEIEIPAERYDAAAIMALMDRHGQPPAVH